MSSRLSEALGVDPAVNLPGALQPGQVTDDDLARLQAFAAAGQQPAQAPGGLFPGERAALQAIPAPQTPFSLMGMAKGAGTGMLDLMELGQTATRPEDIPPSAALAVPAVGGALGAALAPRMSVGIFGGRLTQAQRASLDDFLAGRGSGSDVAGRVTTAPATETVIDRLGALQEMSKFVRTTPAKKPQSLADFIIGAGGLKSEGGEVARLLGGRRGQRGVQRPNLMNDKRGMDLDTAAHLAWESGYIQSPTRPSINRFLRELDKDLHESPVFSSQDRGVEGFSTRARIQDDLDEMGLLASTKGKQRQIENALGRAEGLFESVGAEIPFANPATAALPGILGTGGPVRIPTTQERAAILRGDLL